MLDNVDVLVMKKHNAIIALAKHQYGEDFTRMDNFGISPLTKALCRFLCVDFLEWNNF